MSFITFNDGVDMSAKWSGNYHEDFISLLNNEDKVRSNGFIVFVRGDENLKPLENLCFEQTYNTCLTARYCATTGQLLLPLINKFVEDIKRLSNKEQPSKMQIKGGAPDKAIKTIGAFRLGDPTHEWNQFYNGLSIMYGMKPDDTSFFGRFFDTLKSESVLQRGDRLVIFCEVTGLAEEDATLEGLGFTRDVIRFFDNLPERLGMVFSGIPKHLVISDLCEDCFLSIDGTAEEYIRPGPEQKRPQKLIPDNHKGEDRLGIIEEVQALADAIASNDTKPPLVVGLLGGWGSGKSFVMNLLQERLISIRCEDLSNDEKRKSFPYVGHIYHVHFDAWTYAKKNLWASLMEEIFLSLDHQMGIEKLLRDIENLSLRKDTEVWKLLQALKPDELIHLKNSENGRKAIELVAELDNKELDHNILWDQLSALQKKEIDKLRKKEEEYDEKRQQLLKEENRIEKKVEDKIRLQARDRALSIFKGILVGKVGELLKEAVDKADPKADISIDDAIKSITGIKNEVRKLWSGSSNVTFGFLAISVIIAVIGNYWGELSTYIPASLITTVIAMFQALKATDSRFETFSKEYKIIKDKSVAWQSDERAKLIEKETDESESFQGLKAEFSKIEEEVILLKQNIGFTAEYDTLDEFIKERLYTGDYRKRLGLIHQVQQDIGKLSKSLMSTNHKVKEGPESSADLFPRGTPRIVLFIDDLDRCPPERVVEVLEAAQLLVKTSLFVVVLAMDVRYVTRALEKAYDGVLVRNGMPSGLDYIEKIVQIPYRVRQISPEAMPGYINSQVDIMLEPKNEVSRPDDNNIPETGKEAEITSPGDHGTRLSEILPVETQMLDEGELKMLVDCSNAVESSPRATKRLVNVVKLIKNIWHRRSGESPENKVKQAMILLLTLSAGYPGVMRRLLLEIEKSFNKDTTNNTDDNRNLQTELSKEIDKWSKKEGRLDDWNAVRLLIEDSKHLDLTITMGQIRLDNIQLVRSFSFVGEVDV